MLFPQRKIVRFRLGLVQERCCLWAPRRRRRQSGAPNRRNELAKQLARFLERETGLEPATSSLGRDPELKC
jgi:hypothetical protein